MLLTKLRPNQKEARRRALKSPGFLLLHQQRVGKTLAALSIVDARKPDILIVLCPMPAIKVWKKQMQEHIEWDWGCTKFIVHFEGMCRDPSDRRRWRRELQKWERKGLKVMVIIDEVHRIKGRSSQQSLMAKSLGKYATYRLGLSGTPMDKGLEDLFAIFRFVMPGVLPSLYGPPRHFKGKKPPPNFRDKYLKMGGYQGKKIVGYRNKKKLLKLFHRYSYRITLREAQKEAGRSPYKVRRRVVEFDLKPDSRRVYNELLEELETEVKRRTIRTPMVLTLMSKLQQITGGYILHREPLYDLKGRPRLTPGGKPRVKEEILPIGREKLAALLDLVRTFPKGEKFVICVQYRHEIARIRKRLEREGYSIQTVAGGSPYSGEFTADAIVLQVRSGVAIDLAQASHYVLYSWNHSYIDYEQGMFRILEFTSEQVNYYYLMARDTVDQDFYDSVMTKQKLSTLVCDRYRQEGRRETR